MFKKFYGFSEDPFTLEPDPRFFFLTESHRKVLFSLMYGITEKKGFTLLLGETGTGKTTLIHHLLSRLGPHIKAIPIFAPPKTFDELLEVILRELKLPLEEGNGKSRLWQLNEYLYQRSSQNETLLIIVDEVQNLSKEFLEQLRQLCNPDPIRPRFLQGFLVGKPDIANKLDSWDLRALKQRIVMRRQLGPLTEEESRRYIEHRLNEVGSSLETIFTPEAAALICRHSRGIPRVIHMLCSLALSTGFVLSQKKIDALFIKRILPLLHTQKPSVSQRMESLARNFIDRLPHIPRIMRISYALRSEKKFKTLVENIPLKMYMKDRASVYVFCNEKFAAGLKIKAEDIAGKTDYQLFPAELAEKYVSDDERIMATGQVENIEEEYVHEGQTFIVHKVKKSVKNERGETVGILGIYWDIAEQNRKEDGGRKNCERLEESLSDLTADVQRKKRLLEAEIAKLRQMEERLRGPDGFRRTFEKMATPVTLMGEDKVIPLADAEFEKLSVYSKEEVEGKKCLKDFFHQKDSKRTAEYLATQGANPGAVIGDTGCQLLDKNGDKRDVSLTFSIIPETKRSAASLIEITETTRAEERIEELKEIYVSLIQNTKEGIALVQNGILKFANPRILEILGYTKEELTSKPFREFIFPKDRERFEIQPDKPTNGDLNPTSSIRMIHKDGGVRFLENKETLVHRGKDKAVLHFLTDRTHRKQAEEELRLSIEPFRRLIDTLDKYLIASNGKG
jgi:general secretion pathway protein A